MNNIKSKNLDFIKKPINLRDVNKFNNIKGVIVPHPSLEYGGEISNRVYERINFNNYERVIILSTHHRSNTVISESTEYTYKGTTFKFNYDGLLSVERDDLSYNEEHSWVVHLPYLLKVKKINNIAIILVGKSYNNDLVKDLKNIIKATKTLIIANTDLIHCGKNYNNICPINHHNINKHTISKIQKLDSNGLSSNNQINLLCGIGVIKLFIELGKEFNWVSNLSFYTSNDIENIQRIRNQSKFKKAIKSLFGIREKLFQNSVGYAGIIFTSKLNFWENKDNILTIPRKVFMNKNVKKKLGKRISKMELDNLLQLLNSEFNFINEYDKAFGLFVTAKNENNDLRGCIGELKPTNKLEYEIARLTLMSLFFDLRFHDKMITSKENIRFSINFLGESIQYYPSLSSKIAMITKYDENKIFDAIKDIFKIGLHGLTVQFVNNQSTYLANVLVEHFKFPKGNKLTLDMFMKIIQSLRQKAGTFGQQITKIYLYECVELDELIIGGYKYPIKYTKN
tara:strand:+ start:1097 stop:2629 length:1533 start_codon:yes stop_codon:yes gene_type:complete